MDATDGLQVLPVQLQLVGIRSRELEARVEFRHYQVLAVKLLLHLKSHQPIALDLCRLLAVGVHVEKRRMGVFLGTAVGHVGCSREVDWILIGGARNANLVTAPKCWLV